MRRYRTSFLTPFGQAVMAVTAFAILAGVSLLHLIEGLPIQ